jgi:hypothetical protein
MKVIKIVGITNITLELSAEELYQLDTALGVLISADSAPETPELLTDFQRELINNIRKAL